MGKKRQIGVEWVTERYDDELLKLYIESIYDIIGSDLSIYGDEVNNAIQLDKEKTLDINNSILKTRLGLPSKMSVAGTIAILSTFNSAFVIPPDLIEYMQSIITSKEVFDKYVETLPNKPEIFDEGRNLFNIFIDSGYPSQAAYALIGAAYTECGWDPNQFTMIKKFGVENDWSNCKEGLFGLSNWEMKRKIIQTLQLDQYSSFYGWDTKSASVNKMNIVDSKISLDKNIYNEGPFPSLTNKHGNGCLFQCTEDLWGDIMKEYIKMLPKAVGDEKTIYEYLMYDEDPMNVDDKYDDDHKLIYSAYLFKNHYNIKKDFDELKKILDHNAIYSNSFINDFVQQLMIAYLLGQYVTGYRIEELTLEDIFPQFGRLHMSGYSTKAIFHGGSEEDIEEEYGLLYQAGEGEFDIDAACRWIEEHSSSKSQHVCAKHVRKALEAGGLDTSKRPNWAWQYKKFLPTIGFGLVGIVNKNNTKGYTPQAGDIAVYMQGNNPNVPGHICMWTGKQWCSDFRQKSMVVYQSTQEAYIFRYNFENNIETT